MGQHSNSGEENLIYSNDGEDRSGKILSAAIDAFSGTGEEGDRLTNLVILLMMTNSDEKASAIVLRD